MNKRINFCILTSKFYCYLTESNAPAVYPGNLF